MEWVSLEYIVAAIAGFVFPFIIQKIKKYMPNNQSVTLVLGIVGVGIVYAVNLLFVKLGWSEPMIAKEMWLASFAVVETVAGLTYKTFIKK